MTFQDIISQITAYSQTNPKEFWIILIIILIVLYFTFKGKKKQNQSQIGLNPFQLEVFKRKNQ